MKLRELTFAVTRRCNFRCEHCSVLLLDQKNGEMSQDTIRKAFNCDLINEADIFLTGGEPYVRPDINEVIEILLNSTTGAIKVLTNGSYQSRLRETIRRFQHYKDRLFFSISVDGEEEVHNTIRGNRNSYKLAVESIKLLCNAGYDAHACCIAQPSNVASLQQFKSQLNEQGIRISISPLMEFGKKTNFGKAYAGNEEILWNNLNATPANFSVVASAGKMRIKKCHAGISSAYLSHDGTLAECFVMTDFLPKYREGYQGVIGRLGEDGNNIEEVYNDFSPELRCSLLCPGCTNESEIMREIKWHNMKIPNTHMSWRKFEGEYPDKFLCGSHETDKLLVDGWYFAETEHRWTNKRASIMLKPGTSSIRLELGCFHPNEVSGNVKLSILLNEKKISDITFLYKDRHIFKQYDINNLPTSKDFVELSLITDRPFSLKEDINNRTLGIAVKSIETFRD